MESTMARQPGDDHSISAWRDYDETVVTLHDSMSLGSRALTAEPRVSADDLFAAGARQVTFHKVIDVDSADAAGTVRALTLVRDLTGCGVVVDWKLRVGVGHDDWRVLSHLYPPASVTFDGVAREGGTGDADPQADWASGYLMTKCVTRRGPGLLQIRDRRWGGLRNITIARREYLAVVDRLEYGAPADQVPANILSELRAERLVGFTGGVAWWLPYRLRRWPVAPRVI
jgi:hypothetical protein